MHCHGRRLSFLAMEQTEEIGKDALLAGDLGCLIVLLYRDSGKRLGGRVFGRYALKGKPLQGGSDGFGLGEPSIAQQAVKIF